MAYFTRKPVFLFYSLPLPSEEVRRLDDFLNLLDESGLDQFLIFDDPGTGRPSYPPNRLFAAILLCFALGKASLREIETACWSDLRVIYLTGNVTPSYVTISRFINAVILPHIEEIFTCLTKAIFKHLAIDMRSVFLDGTKQAARPNKYKFVWKPTFFHNRLSDKIRTLLKIMGLEKDVPSEGIIPVSFIVRKHALAQALDPATIEGGEKVLRQMQKSLSEYLVKAMEYEEKEEICGPDRNSYFKTDHDATAMCLKQDYYSGLGSNLHAAYNAQILISHGFVVSYYLSQDRTDYHTLIPTLKTFKKNYGFFPEKLAADSGYGIFENYEFCRKEKIKAFIKYQSWTGEKTGRRPALFELLDNNSIRCLDGRIGEVVELPEGRYPKTSSSKFFKVKPCTGCQFMPYCRRFMNKKEDDERIFEVNIAYQCLKQKARDLLLSREGIEMRINRSCQAEGVFGNIKQNMGYWRSRRVLKPNVTLEFALTCLGMNLRKFLKYALLGKVPEYWVLSDDVMPETFKKPSAKRLANRERKRQEKQREKQPNEKAKSEYKYKSGGK